MVGGVTERWQGCGVDVTASEAIESLRRAGVGRGDLVGLAVAPGVGLGLAVTSNETIVVGERTDPGQLVSTIDAELGPRWVMWSSDTAVALVDMGVRVTRSWDLVAVHRLIEGGWRADPARVWAAAQGLPTDEIPSERPHDLFSQDGSPGDPDDPVDPDGHLRPEWVGGGWAASATRLGRWAVLARAAADLQRNVLDAMSDRPTAVATARSESAAELLCVELAADGLPVDRRVGAGLIEGFVGPRPENDDQAAAELRRRQADVLRHAPPGSDFDLRSPAQVKSLLRRVGVEVPDTRAHRLESLRGTHPIIEPLLAFRKAERINTTYGYAWLDEHVGDDGRLRGSWTGCDGAAGRMTASSGLHNLPTDLRAAVVAEPGHVFVRADLGQIEPRVLASVSGDRDLARACQADDLYAPVAQQLGVDRATAKVAVLGAMYGQTTGRGAEALSRLESTYPVAMGYLNAAAHEAEAGRDLRTYGGRLVRMGPTAVDGRSEREVRSASAARGRYGRNAMVQGAAAELFKVWAVTVRARGSALDARIVLCLHDELLVHVPEENGEAAARLVDDCLVEAAHRWAPDRSVRFLADTVVVRRWSDAKDPA